MGCYPRHLHPSTEKIEQQFNLSKVLRKKKANVSTMFRWNDRFHVFLHITDQSSHFSRTNRKRQRWKRINCVWHTHSKHTPRIVHRIMFLDRSRFIFVSTNFSFSHLWHHTKHFSISRHNHKSLKHETKHTQEIKTLFLRNFSSHSDRSKQIPINFSSSLLFWICLGLRKWKLVESVLRAGLVLHASRKKG